MALIESKDNFDLLKEAFVANENRRIYWTVDNPKRDTRFFKKFTFDSIALMTNEDIMY